MKKTVIFMLLIYISLFAGTYKTIETPNVRVVYEDGLEEEAQQIANLIDNLKGFYEKDGFQGNLKQIPVILKKGNNISNAFFTGMPNKLEYITTAPISNKLGVTPWLVDLSIHEYRHFMQYQLVKENSINKGLYILGGDEATQIFGTLTIPNWVWEGEATYYETKLSNNGRGRTPDFLKNYRAILNEGEVYSYEKAKNSSYKDIVPSMYHLGYLLINYGYEKYGNKFWEEVFVEGSGAISFTPFSKIIKKKTGLSSTEFYNEAMAYYKEYFKAEKSVIYKNLLEENKIPTNEYFAYEYGNDLITLIKGYDEKSSFYKINGNKKEKVLDTGLMVDEYFEVKKGKIIWSEIEPHLTKTDVNFSNIKIFDLKSGKKLSVTKNSNYHSPSLSNSGEKIAVINNSGTEDTKIYILDTNGNLIKELPNASRYFYNYIKWSEDDKSLIISLRDENGKMALKNINLETNEEKTYLDFDNYTIGVPFVKGDKIYFEASFDLTENIYSINTENKMLKKITESNIGAIGVTIVDGKVYFSEYGKKGYSLKETADTEGITFKTTTLTENEKMNFDLLKDSDFKLGESDLNKVYKTKNYNYLGYLLNAHSWSYSYLMGVLDLSLTSTNELQDFNLMARSTMDSVNDKGTFLISGEYTRYWPKLQVQYESDREKNILDETLILNINFPFYLSKDEYFKMATINTGYLHSLNNDEKQDFLNLGFSFINSKYKAYRDLNSPWEQSVSLDYVTDLDSLKNSRVTLKSSLSSKGFFENDNFLLSIDAEKNFGDLDLLDSGIMSRAYENVDYESAIKTSLEYKFPIAYPDMGGKGLFFQRGRGDLFYDNTLIENNGKTNYSTLGLGYNYDVTLLSLLPISLRLQYAYLLQEEEFKFDVGIEGLM